MASSSPPPDLDDGSDEDVYVVKKILAEADTDEERVFLIEWEGYPIEESTWEPEANVLSKDTLKAWKEEKLRQREGLSQPFDTDEFDRRVEEYAKRKRRHEKLGLPPQSKPSESEDSGDSSSDQAEESYVGVADYEGIPSPKKPRRPLVKSHDPTFRDDDVVMNDASDNSDGTPIERRRPSKPAKERSATSEDQQRRGARPTKFGTSGSETKANAHKASIVEAPSATGYQGTANRAPAAPSTIIPRGRSSRGKSGTTSRGGHMAMSKPKVRRTIENRLLKETRSKETKAPQLFATKSMERKFELGARALADRPPAQLPRLINPAEYAGPGRIRKRGQAPVSAGSQSSQTPVSASGVAGISATPVSATATQQPVISSTAAVAPMAPPMAHMAPMVSSPEAMHPEQESTGADEGLDQPVQPTSAAAPSEALPVTVSRPLISPFGFTSSTPVQSAPATFGAVDAANSLPSAPVRKVSLANYSAKQNDVAPKAVSMDNQAQGGWGGLTLKSFLGYNSQAQDDPIMLTFVDSDVQSIGWGAAVQQLQSKDVTFSHICRSTDVDNFTSEFKPTLLSRGRVTVAAGDDNKSRERISALAEYLRLSISGLLYNLESLNIMIYPTRCEEWKFIEYGLQSPHSGELSFFSFTTQSKMLCDSYDEKAQMRIAKMRIEVYEDYDRLNRAIFGFSYRGLHQVDKKSPHDFFFLLFPNMASPLAEHTAAWLRSSNKDCKIYTCQQAGSWNLFLGCVNNPEGGSLIMHYKMMPLIPRYPRLQRFLSNGLNNVWCIDERFTHGQYMTRLFPQGGAVCLTSGFLSGEPEMAMAFLSWFLPKRESRASTGTWKLFVCHGVYKFLCDQAFGATKRRIELLDSLPGSLTESQKETLASSSGLSKKSCQDRLDLKEEIGRLIRPRSDGERDLDVMLQADRKRSLIAFADEDIKPSDDHGLIRNFAYWATLRLASCRKFIAIGSKAIPGDHEGAVAQAAEVSKSSRTKLPAKNTSQNGAPSKSPRKSRWKRDAFASVDGANDDKDSDLEAGEINSDEEREPNEFTTETDPEILRFIVETGAGPSEAAEFLKLAQGNQDQAVKLYEITEAGATPSEAVDFLERARGNQELAVKLYGFAQRTKSQGKPAAETSSAAETLPAPVSPNVTKENAAIPSTENVTAEDIAMEDAPETAPQAPQPTNGNSPAQKKTPDAESSSQTSNAGIITTESGSRFVPRSMRTSGSVRSELNIRPGYVAPEDEVYKVRRGRSESVEGASRSSSRGADEERRGDRAKSKSISRSGSRGADGRRGGEAASMSPRGGLTPVTPATPGQNDRMEGVEGAEKKMEEKLSSLEWYAERKLKGDEWNHIAVVGWEEAFGLLRVEYKKT